jgi:hypothetical protein
LLKESIDEPLSCPSTCSVCLATITLTNTAMVRKTYYNSETDERNCNIKLFLG